MNAVFPFFSLFAVAVSGAPLLFNSDLLKHGDVHGRLSVLTHRSFHLGEDTKEVGFVFGASTPVLRFLHLVPKFAKVATLNGDGFASKHFGEGHSEKHHEFLHLDDNELLVDLVGLSDCRTWDAVLVRHWNGAAGVETRRAFAHLKGTDGKLERFDLSKFHKDPLKALADFVHTHAGLDVLKGLLHKGVPAHVLTHHLHDRVKHLL